MRATGTPESVARLSPDDLRAFRDRHVVARNGVLTIFGDVRAVAPENCQRQVLPGDLLFFRTDASGDISHVGIYAGQGQMIHASSSSGQVRKVSLGQRYWQQRMVGGATFLGIGNPPVTRRGSATDSPNG